MNEETLRGKKLGLYALLKILKYCTGSSARSYQCKYAVNVLQYNKSIEYGMSMEWFGAAIKEVIYHKTIRGKFSSVHPDLAAIGITRVEVGEEGLYFIANNSPGVAWIIQYIQSIFIKSRKILYIYKGPDEEYEEEEVMLRQAIALSLEEEEHLKIKDWG